MPIDVLKIDRSFVVHMLESKKHHAIIRTIIALANSLDLAVIAEGVETAEQLNALAELGCQYAQGYLISRPATAERATEILQGGKLGHHGLR
jgi:EAL domain-containing protein (putative c-di-GMP-specific phosphodiesterase class I)